MFLNVTVPKFNIRSVFFFLTYPVQVSVSAVGSFFVNSAAGIAKIQTLEKELKQDKEEMKMYRKALVAFFEMDKENQELRNVLNMKPKITQNSIYARVVFRDPNLTGDYYIIDKGFMDGIKQNMAVVSYGENGSIFLLGKISEVNVSASKIKLLTSADSFVGVTIGNQGYVGILQGHGSWNQECTVEFIPVEAAAQTGDEIYTSGESDIYPPGILIGKIDGINVSRSEEFFKRLFVKPEMKYSRIRDVFVIDWSPGIEINSLIEKSTHEQ